MSSDLNLLGPSIARLPLRGQSEASSAVQKKKRRASYRPISIFSSFCTAANHLRPCHTRGGANLDLASRAVSSAIAHLARVQRELNRPLWLAGAAPHLSSRRLFLGMLRRLPLGPA